MAERFGIPQIHEYLTRMGLKIARLDLERELVELAFHGNQGQWRLVIGLRQSGDARKLMVVVPHIASLTATKRQECLEALMVVNYRIAIGKFGLDLEDGEIRLEETIPLANNDLTFEQFRQALGAILQTVGLYQSLLSRIVFGNLSIQDAIKACERDFFQKEEDSQSEQASQSQTEAKSSPLTEAPTELDVNDVLAEVARLLEEKQQE